MNPRINPNILKIFAAIFIVPIILIFLLGVGMATAGWIKYASANLSDYLPIVMKLKGAPVVTPAPPDALIVFSSTATTDGNAGGRTSMTQICLSEDPASHFCNLGEIETAFTNRGVIFLSPFSKAWIDHVYIYTDTGSPNYVTRSVWNDLTCMGWLYNANDKSGISITYSATEYEYNVVCNEVHPVTCCK